MAICTEKPDVPLDPIDLEAVGDQSHYPLTRGGSRRRGTSPAPIPSPMSQQASMSDFKPNTPGGLANVSTFNPRAGFQQTPSNGPSTQASRSPAFPRQTNLANGMSGGVRLGNKPSLTPNSLSTSGFESEMSSQRLSAPPHSTHPEPPTTDGFRPPYTHNPHYVSCAILVTVPSESLILISFH